MADGKAGVWLLLLFSALPATCRGEWQQRSGEMHFAGAVISSSCRAGIADAQLTVNMGAVSSYRFHFVGEDVDPVPFDIQLRGCSRSVLRRVGVAFRGVASGENPDLLSVGNSAQSATGLGIALFDSAGRFIPLNSLSDASVSRERKTMLRFVAKYRATREEVGGGVVNAQAWFYLIYP